jgi:hypothetical protein
VQPRGFFSYLWKGLTSCVWGDQNNQHNFAPLEHEEELQELEIVVQRRPENHWVSEGNYETLILGDSYHPGFFTACGMVFVFGEEGGCVYHWPFHTASGQYLAKMEAAMRQAGVARAVACQVFGRDYDLGNSKRGEYLDGWHDFGNYIEENLGVAPEIFLCEDNYSTAFLAYTNQGVNSRFPTFTPLATLRR